MISTWIPVNYGQILAFDQSLPHTLNEEVNTHCLNCRFELHAQGQKLGEYFMR